MQELLPFIIVGIVTGSIYAISAVGLVLSYRTSGVLNFAHGAIAAIAAALFYQLHVTEGMHWIPAATITIAAVGFGMGLIMERLGLALAHAATAMKIVATVAMMISLTAIFQLWQGFGAQAYPEFLPVGRFRIANADVSYGQVVIVVLGLVAVLSLTALLNYTAFGRNTRAVIDSPELFELTGQAASRVRRRGWMIGSGFAALSGVLIAPSLGLDATALTLLVLQSFGAAAVGRFSNLWGAYAGAMFIGIAGAIATKYAVTNPSLGGLPSALPFIVLFVVLLVTPARHFVEFGSGINRTALVPDTASLRRRAIGLAVPVAALCVVPHVVGSKLPYWTTGLVFMVIFLGLGLIIRVSGQVSLCHMSFAAIGAVGMYKLLDAGFPWVVALLLGALFAVPVGALIAVPAVRLSGVYLALATFGFGILLEQQLYGTDLMFGTSAAPLRIPRPSFAESPQAYYYLVLVFVILALGLVRLVERTQLGRLLRARAGSPTAFVSLGASSRVPPLLAFCISAFVAGIGGGLLGPVFEVAGPGQFQTVPTSLVIVALIVLAGSDPRMRLFGVSLGAAIGLQIIPGYLGDARDQAMLNVLFGLAALGIALASSGLRFRAPHRGVRISTASNESDLTGNEEKVEVGGRI